jgi:hypothetical protein
MQQFLYMIGNFGSPADSYENGIQILKIPYLEIRIKDVRIYNSLEDLQENDAVFKSLTSEQQKRIIDPKNIQEAKYLVPVNENKLIVNFNNTATFIQHVILGDIYGGKVLGVHHLLGLHSSNTKITKILSGPDRHGIYEAEVIKRDSRHKNNPDIKEFRIKRHSTFFPDNWSYENLLEECIYAFKNKIIESSDDYSKKWQSITLSGVKVTIYTDILDNLKSMFPILNS